MLRVPDDLVDFTPALREQALKQLPRRQPRQTPAASPMTYKLDGKQYIYEDDAAPILP